MNEHVIASFVAYNTEQREDLWPCRVEVHGQDGYHGGPQRDPTSYDWPPVEEEHQKVGNNDTQAEYEHAAN